LLRTYVAEDRRPLDREIGMCREAAFADDGRPAARGIDYRVVNSNVEWIERTRKRLGIAVTVFAFWMLKVQRSNNAMVDDQTAVRKARRDTGMLWLTPACNMCRSTARNEGRMAEHNSTLAGGLHCPRVWHELRYTLRAAVGTAGLWFSATVRIGRSATTRLAVQFLNAHRRATNKKSVEHDLAVAAELNRPRVGTVLIAA
jgi:hypothetical protein